MNHLDTTNIQRLARELGQVKDAYWVYDEYSVDRRLSKPQRDWCDEQRSLEGDSEEDLRAAILLTRAECLDDVVIQAAAAVCIADILDACEGPRLKHYMDQLKAAIDSMALVLIRDHGDAYRKLLGSDFLQLELLLATNQRISKDGLTGQMELVANSDWVPS